MAFARWDPLQDLLALNERMTRLAGMDAPGWVPAVDLYETAEHFYVTVELPGLSRDDIQVQVQEGKLTLRGRRPTRPPGCCEQYHRVERGHGTFARTFILPPSIEAQNIRADLEQGLLTIIIPMTGPATRRVEVQ